jgi:cysteine desulfurase
MLRGFEIWANPSSPHGEGRAARAALEDAREQVKTALAWNGEVIFTSGASEAAALAMDQAVGSDRFVSAVEHEAILAAAPDAALLPVLPDGRVDKDTMTSILAETVEPVVAIQWINSETGNGQELGELLGPIHDSGGLAIVDCSQGVGKFHMPVFVDMAIVSAHKFGGPIGVGALLVRDFSMLKPSGGHERGYRRGTENLPGVLGMAAALEVSQPPYLQDGMGPAVRGFEDAIRGAGGELLSDRIFCPTMIEAVAMPGLSAAAQLMRFDLAGISVSQGSACSSGTMKRSHVLSAMGVPEELAERTIRVSFGWNTTREEVERFCEVWLEMAREAAERVA